HPPVSRRAAHLPSALSYIQPASCPHTNLRPPTRHARSALDLFDSIEFRQVSPSHPLSSPPLLVSCCCALRPSLRPPPAACTPLPFANVNNVNGPPHTEQHPFPRRFLCQVGRIPLPTPHFTLHSICSARCVARPFSRPPTPCPLLLRAPRYQQPL
ncbi:hypothetical protein BKA80DRAFT_293481, partial [Phyllosticta citrichinensis]